MPKTRVVLQLEPKQVAALRKMKLKTGASVAELLRRMIAAGWDKVAR